MKTELVRSIHERIVRGRSEYLRGLAVVKELGERNRGPFGLRTCGVVCCLRSTSITAVSLTNDLNVHLFFECLLLDCRHNVPD